MQPNQRTWAEAVERWHTEAYEKRSYQKDCSRLKPLNHYLGTAPLTNITYDQVEWLKRTRKADGVSNATVNRMLALLRFILRKSAREWGYLDKAPYVRLLPEPKKRVRFLTPTEAMRLINQLPQHSAMAARFALATGLRQSNVLQLEWSQIDLKRAMCWIYPDQAKAGKAIGVPLNADALAVLYAQRGQHRTYVFVYQGKPIKKVVTKAWYRALDRAGISDFTWHDWRHTWASWHVQNGTPLHVLQELGGWESVEMVQRYAHLGKEHLRQYVDAVVLPR